MRLRWILQIPLFGRRCVMDLWSRVVSAAASRGDAAGGAWRMRGLWREGGDDGITATPVTRLATTRGRHRFWQIRVLFVVRVFAAARCSVWRQRRVRALGRGRKRLRGVVVHRRRIGGGLRLDVHGRVDMRRGRGVSHVIAECEASLRRQDFVTYNLRRSRTWTNLGLGSLPSRQRAKAGRRLGLVLLPITAARRRSLRRAPTHCEADKTAARHQLVLTLLAASPRAWSPCQLSQAEQLPPPS
jgi:hypothetical protein